MKVPVRFFELKSPWCSLGAGLVLRWEKDHIVVQEDGDVRFQYVIRGDFTLTLLLNPVKDTKPL
jgi:hypothetical protein